MSDRPYALRKSWLRSAHTDDGRSDRSDYGSRSYARDEDRTSQLFISKHASPACKVQRHQDCEQPWCLCSCH